MIIHFDKMQGTGNDFVVIDAVSQDVSLTKNQLKKWADRHYGIGFDQLLLIRGPQHKDADFFFHIYNADGSEVEQCGNGARCVARYLKEHGKISGANFTLETISGLYDAEVRQLDKVTIAMGVPLFEPSKIPFLAESPHNPHVIHIPSGKRDITVVNMGNPHAIVFVYDLEAEDIDIIGREIAEHAAFPSGVNVGFVQVMSENEIRLVTVERGVGRTQACGSSACASAAASISLGLCHTPITVYMPGGELTIKWDGGPNESVWMSGSAEKVFSGSIEL